MEQLLPEQVTVEGPSEDYSKLYKIIGDEIATIICKGIYTKKEGDLENPQNNCPETNLIENINMMITKSIIQQLTVPDIKENIQTIILGNGDKINPTGLRKYINSLIKVSAGNDKTQIYAFTARILQVLFNKKDKTFDSILGGIKYDDDSDEDIIEKIKVKILEELQREGGQGEEGQGQGQGQEEKKVEAQAQEKVEAQVTKVEAQETESSCKIILMSNPVSEQRKLVNSDTVKFVDSAQSVLMGINTYLSGEEFKEKIKETLDTSIKTVLEGTLANITNSISTSVIDEYTKKFTNSRVIKLQLLYSILSYDLSDEDDENDLKNNTLYIAKEFFVQAVKMKKEKKDGKPITTDSITTLFNEILVTAIRQRSGGDYTGSAVTALTSSIVNSSITGGRRKTGKRKTGKRTTGKRRKTGKKKSRISTRRKSIRK